MSLHINYPSVLFWTFFSADVYFKCVWPVFHPQRPITSKQGVDMKRSLLAGHCFFCQPVILPGGDRYASESAKRDGPVRALCRD